jgi:hypothetical protein
VPLVLEILSAEINDGQSVLLRGGSSYWQPQAVKFRYPPESGYTIGLIFSAADSCKRPVAALQELRFGMLILKLLCFSLKIAAMSLS